MRRDQKEIRGEEKAGVERRNGEGKEREEERKKKKDTEKETNKNAHM